MADTSSRSGTLNADGFSTLTTGTCLAGGVTSEAVVATSRSCGVFEASGTEATEGVGVGATEDALGAVDIGLELEEAAVVLG